MLPYIIGPYGGLIMLFFGASSIIWFLLREVKTVRKENQELRSELQRQFEERINDAKGSDLVARAYLKLREREGP